ncbi:MAG TPA: glutaredoxin family protein [Candidatus Saccharimonadales bacterium]|nr:glutaredoxin family protein [Candidatus Saccharimonadales bacterium]
MTPTIVMYSSPTCAYCHLAAEYFEKLGLKFTDKDISQDREALEFIMEKVGQAVTPVITINDTIIIGFDKPKIDEALEEAKKAKHSTKEEK